jgi:TonB family protein
MNTDMNPFSYFKRIFIPSKRIDESSFDSIVAHERSHLRQGHYIDLFIVEITTVIQWFNPIIWLYEKSIKEIHEYLADETVLNSGNNKGKYQALLVNQAIGGPVFILTNQFNQSLAKKRIMMMKKMKSSRTAQLKALFIVPLIVALLMAFNGQQLTSQSLSGGKSITVTGSITDRSTGKPVPGSVAMIKGTNEGTIASADGNYQIIVENSDAYLLFSHIGYRTQIIQVDGNSKINVLLEQDILTLDFSNLKDLDVRDHGAVSEKIEAYYVVAEEYPTYPGGMEALLAFINSNMHYPSEARDKGIEGKVMVNFTINEHGDVENAKVLFGVSPELDEEALRLTNSMRGWTSAAQNGKLISTSVNMPIEFKMK